MLRPELPGLLAWAVQGCIAWQQDGLQSPEPVRAATASYREDMDRLGQWIIERCIVDPFGKFLAGPSFEEETILVAELDRNQIPRAKFDFDAVGHYARPDVFRMIVDERPKPVVSLDQVLKHDE